MLSGLLWQVPQPQPPARPLLHADLSLSLFLFLSTYLPQEELEEVLFGLLRQRGYGDEYVRRYQMVTAFFQQKRPLIVLVAGSACTGAEEAGA